MDYTVHGILQARILEWVAFPFSRASSQPRDRTQVSCIIAGFFISWAAREALFSMWELRLEPWDLSLFQMQAFNSIHFPLSMALAASHKLWRVVFSFSQFFFKQKVFFSLYIIYLAASGLSWGTQHLHCVKSFVVVHRLSSCGVWAPKCMGSVLAVLEHSCSVACGILFPRPGIEPTSPALQGGFWTIGPPRKSHQNTWCSLKTSSLTHGLLRCLIPKCLEVFQLSFCYWLLV